MRTSPPVEAIITRSSSSTPASVARTRFDTADFLGVSLRTLNSWKIQHPEFLQSLKTGKEHPDERVMNSLYHRAVGYTYSVGKKKVHLPPDVTACIFWLKNRRPDLWRDNHDLTVAKPPEDTRSLQQQWDDLVTAMLRSGAIALVPDHLQDEPQSQLLGKLNGDGAR